MKMYFIFFTVTIYQWKYVVGHLAQACFYIIYFSSMCFFIFPSFLIFLDSDFSYFHCSHIPTFYFLFFLQKPNTFRGQTSNINMLSDRSMHQELLRLNELKFMTHPKVINSPRILLTINKTRVLGSLHCSSLCNCYSISFIFPHFSSIFLRNSQDEGGVYSLQKSAFALFCEGDKL